MRVGLSWPGSKLDPRARHEHVNVVIRRAGAAQFVVAEQRVDIGTSVRKVLHRHQSPRCGVVVVLRDLVVIAVVDCKRRRTQRSQIDDVAQLGIAEIWVVAARRLGIALARGDGDVESTVEAKRKRTVDLRLDTRRGTRLVGKAKPGSNRQARVFAAVG